MLGITRFAAAMGSIGLVAAMSGGCSGRASLLPNADPGLRKTSTEFAVDAAKRFPFKADAPDGGKANGRAQVAYVFKRLEIVNLSSETWTDVEIWINQQYVVAVPKMEPNQLKRLPFQMFYDAEGHYFPKDGSTKDQTLVKKVNMFRDGKMYEVPLQLAD